jgi:hypothetical protein
MSRPLPAWIALRPRTEADRERLRGIRAATRRFSGGLTPVKGYGSTSSAPNALKTASRGQDLAARGSLPDTATPKMGPDALRAYTDRTIGPFRPPAPPTGAADAPELP